MGGLQYPLFQTHLYIMTFINVSTLSKVLDNLLHM